MPSLGEGIFPRRSALTACHTIHTMYKFGGNLDAIPTKTGATPVHGGNWRQYFGLQLEKCKPADLPYDLTVPERNCCVMFALDQSKGSSKFVAAIDQIGCHDCAQNCKFAAGVNLLIRICLQLIIEQPSDFPSISFRSRCSYSRRSYKRHCDADKAHFILCSESIHSSLQPGSAQVRASAR